MICRTYGFSISFIDAETSLQRGLLYCLSVVTMVKIDPLVFEKILIVTATMIITTGGNVSGHKRKMVFIVWVFCVVALLSGCKTLTTPAFTYEQPKADPDLSVDIYKPYKAYNGTTLFADYHKPHRPRIIEVNMRGEIVWEYVLPGYLREYIHPGFDVELLPNNNILFVAPRKGVYEVNRNGKIVWSYEDKKVSHDADRLPNGNTLVVWCCSNDKSEAVVKEINPRGGIVWSWSAKKYFNKPPYNDISFQGWTHANAVSRLPNGNTIISLRNFDLTVEVDPQGAVVWSFDCGFLGTYPHEPEILPNDNMLVAIHCPPPGCWDQVVEIKRPTKEIVWHFTTRGMKVTRDADRLPNGNTLIVERIKIFEVTPDGEIVWRLRLRGVSGMKRDFEKFFYKAQRIPPH